MEPWNKSRCTVTLSGFVKVSFHYCSYCTKDVLAYTKALSRKIQGRYVELSGHMKKLHLWSPHSTVPGMMLIVSIHRSMTMHYLLLPKCMLNKAFQGHRSNVPAATALEYYKWVLTISMLDYIIAEMEERFQHESSAIVCQIMLLLPSRLVVNEEI